MTDPAPQHAASAASSSSSFLDGIGADYRKRIDELWDNKTKGLGAQRVYTIVCGLLFAGIGTLGTYVWQQLAAFDEKTKQARSDIDAAVHGTNVPIGTILAWPGDLPYKKDEANIGSGDWYYHWRPCDGGTVYKSTHKALDQVLGTTYGDAGPGLIRLPDLRGQFLRGYQKDVSLDLGKAQASSIQEHSHILLGIDRASSQNTGPFPGFALGVVKVSKDHKLDTLLAGAVCANGSPPSPFAHGMSLPPLKADEQQKARQGDKETRPTNYAIHWIIRVR